MNAITVLDLHFQRRVVLVVVVVYKKKSSSWLVAVHVIVVT